MPTGTSAATVTVNRLATGCGPLSSGPGGVVFCAATMPGCEKCNFATSSRSLPEIVTSTVAPCLAPAGKTADNRAAGSCAKAVEASNRQAKPAASEGRFLGNESEATMDCDMVGP